MRKIKKGFTLVELVVVIAIIAILAGVSIGVYAGITNSAKLSNDKTEIHQMNTMVASYEILKEDIKVSELVSNLKKDGFDLAEKKPYTSNASYAFNAKTNRFELLNSNDGSVLFAEESGIESTFQDKYFIATNEEGLKLNGNVLITKNVELAEGNIEFTSLKSYMSTDETMIIGDVSYNTAASGNLNIDGNIAGNLNINCANAHIEHNGFVDHKTTISAVGESSYVENGYTWQLDIGTGTYEIGNEGVVLEVTGINSDFASFINRGYVNFIRKEVFGNFSTKINNDGFLGLVNCTETQQNRVDSSAMHRDNKIRQSIGDANISDSYNVDNKVQINRVLDLLKFSAKTQHSDSLYIKHNSLNDFDYNLVHVDLNCDINLSNIEWIPIAAWNIDYLRNCGCSRSDGAFYSSIINQDIHLVFDGHDHIIKNLRDSLVGTAGFESVFKNIRVIFDADYTDATSSTANVLRMNDGTNKIYKVQIYRYDTDIFWAPSLVMGLNLSSDEVFDSSKYITYDNLTLDGRIFINWNTSSTYAKKSGSNYVVCNAYSATMYGSSFDLINVTNCLNNTYISNSLLGANTNATTLGDKNSAYGYHESSKCGALQNN